MGQTCQALSSKEIEIFFICQTEAAEPPCRALYSKLLLYMYIIFLSYTSCQKKGPAQALQAPSGAKKRALKGLLMVEISGLEPLTLTLPV